MSKEPESLIVDEYGDHEVQEYANTPVPTFLKWVYVILPIWGALWFYLYWDGSTGWLDRGYWSELEAAANTTMEVEASW